MFFAPVRNREVLERVDFYRQDLECLRQIGCDVTVATRWREIPWDADVYYVWWWTWAWLPLAKALLRRRPVIITGVFDYRWPQLPRGGYHSRPLWERALMRVALRAARANVFISGHEYREVVQALGASNPLYSPLTVDTERLACGVADREPLVFTVAWSGWENAQRKCLPQILQAIPLIRAKRPDVRFVIAGEQGSYFPQLQRLVLALGISEAVEFPGVMSEDEKIALMQRASIYLQPSGYEGFGLAVVEAMSCGAAVVTSPVGAIPEVVGDTALFVDGRSPQQIAAAVLDLFADDARRACLGRKAAQRARQLFPRQRRRSDLEVILNAVMRGATVRLPDWERT